MEKNHMHTRFLKLAAVSAVALVAAACGDGPELIDRTQPNYVKKSDITQGTWYLQETVVDVPPTSPISFVGYQQEMEKVRFEVQEDYLVAYRSYEFFPGSDPNVDHEKSTIGKVVTVDGKLYRGAPVAAWRIQSHFDRIRSYNPATGEQGNVLEENTNDRPWYERDFMRVDWGSNQITNWNSLTSDTESYINPYVQPVEDDAGDDAFYTAYEEKNGQQVLNYFDFTARQFWSPPSRDYPGYGAIPYCWLNPAVDCHGAVIKVRTSVRKVNEAHVADYEPLTYDDQMMKKFGYFRAGMALERPTYDPERGATISGRLLFAQRLNIWERAHDAQGNKIPVEQRQPKPIVYHLSDNFPKELNPSARDIEASWDRAFRKAVAVPRGLEISEIPQMFFLCENPVPAGAPAACGPEGTHVRMGDIRYHMFNWVDVPQMASPLGYGPAGLDPETGEVIHAVANLYGAGLDSIAGETLQTLDVLTGEISLEDLIAGKDVKDYLAGNRNATDPRRDDGPAQSKQGLTSDAEASGASFARIQGTLKEKISAYQLRGSLPIVQTNRREIANRLIAQNPQLEAALVDIPEVRAAVLASAPGDTWRQRLMADSQLYRTVARDVLMRMDELQAMQDARAKWASSKNLWLAEFSDGAYIGLAKDVKALFDAKKTEYQAQGLSAVEAHTKAKTDAWTLVRNGLNRMVGEHELGHTLGLMHNFAGTYDAMNFLDGYWDLRKDTIGVMAGGQRVLPLSPQDLLDASIPTQAQLEAGLKSLEYSTVMDYPARFPIHHHGVGKYDEAAILFAYSGGNEPGWVEVFNTTRANTDTSAYASPNMKVPTTNLAKPLVVRGAHVEVPFAHVTHYNTVSKMYSDRFHYTTLPFHFADKGLPFEQALEQGIDRIQSRSFRKWSEMAPIYEEIEKRWVQYQLDFATLDTDGYDEAQEVVKDIVAGKPVEVPYMFCANREAGANMACNLWDSGADYFEMTRDWIERYNEYYAFSNFKRDRYFFSPFSVLNRKLGRFTSNLPNVYHHWLFDIYLYQDAYELTSQEMEQYLGAGDPIFQNYWTMAVIDSVNHLLGELATPSVGYFGKSKATGRWVHLEENNSNNTRFADGDEQTLKGQLTTGANAPYGEIVYVPRGPGRSMYTLFESEGYDFYRRVDEVGHFWDQYGALIALTQSDTNFIGVDSGADQLRYSLPYYMTFPKELSRAATSVWLEDGATLSSGLVKTGNGLASVEQPVFVRGENYIRGFQYPPLPVTHPDETVAPTELVEASPPWSTRFYTQLFGMAYFTENLDQDFANQNRVFKLGSGESMTPAPGYKLETFADPFGGGYIYAAPSKDDGSAPVAAPRQILMAKDFKAKWDAAVSAGDAFEAAKWEAKTRDAVRNLEMMRGLSSIFGQ